MPNPDIQDLLGLDNCPKCFTRWRYVYRGRKRLDLIRDPQFYECPGCGERWDR